MQSLDSVRDYLSTPICAVVSTLRADGSPHQTVLHYWLEEKASIRGEAAKSYEGPEAVEDAMDLARPLQRPSEYFAKLERVTFVIEPERLFEYGAAPAPG